MNVQQTGTSFLRVVICYLQCTNILVLKRNKNNIKFSESTYCNNETEDITKNDNKNINRTNPIKNPTKFVYYSEMS